MNKQLLIVLLAVCLVSTHAFVKRDATTAADVQAQIDIAKANLEKIFNQATEQVKDNLNPQIDIAKANLEKLVKQVTEQVNDNLNPDVISKNVQDFQAAVKETADKLVNSFTPTTEAPKPAA